MTDYAIEWVNGQRVKRAMSADEVAALRPAPPPPPTREEQGAARAAAYVAEADPLFFKWQAGEGTEAEWLAKREEIRARYPYPDEE